MARVHVLELPPNIQTVIDENIADYDLLLHDPVGEVKVGDLIRIPSFLSGAGDMEVNSNACVAMNNSFFTMY